MEKLIILGAGGHAKSVIDTLRQLKCFEIVGMLDKKEKIGNTIEGIPIIGADKDMLQYYEQGIKCMFIGVGSLGDTKLRCRLYDEAKKIGFKFPSIIDTTAIVSSNVIVDEGCYIGKGSVINTGSRIGKQCIVNTGAIVEHDCNIDEFVHIGPRAVLSGNVQVGAHTHIGVNSTVIQGIHIGEHTLIGAGSVVVKDIGSYKKAYGNPCKVVEEG